jgi:hypothetical protein
MTNEEMQIGQLFKVTDHKIAVYYYKKLADNSAERLFLIDRNGKIGTSYRGGTVVIIGDNHEPLSEAEAFEVALLDATLPAGESDQ